MLVIICVCIITGIRIIINHRINWPATLAGSRLTALGHGFCICEWLARAQGPRHPCRHRRERLAHERHEAPKCGAATAELLQWCLGSAPAIGVWALLERGMVALGLSRWRVPWLVRGADVFGQVFRIMRRPFLAGTRGIWPEHVLSNLRAIE